MSSPKRIAIFGATGKQGGSVARSLVRDKAFAVRAITRKPDSDAAKGLAALGIEIVQADAADKDQMKNAFQDSWGAYVNTLPFQELDEYNLGKNVIDAAADAGVRNIVYSSAADTVGLTNGEVTCSIMMAKHNILQYARACPTFSNVISVDAGYYFENFLATENLPIYGGFPSLPDEEGYLTLKVPRWGNSPERVPMVAIGEDYGPIVHGVFLDPVKYHNKLVQGVSDIKSFPEITDAFSKVTGKKTRVQYVEELETHGILPLEEVKKMFRFLQKVQGRYFNGQNSENETASQLKAATFRAIGTREDPKLTDAETWFRKYFADK